MVIQLAHLHFVLAIGNDDGGGGNGGGNGHISSDSIDVVKAKPTRADDAPTC